MNFINSSLDPSHGSGATSAKPIWRNIDKLFLDMDGTLLDKYFDDYFWEQFVPKKYASKNGVDYQKARNILLQTYKSIENTLAWTDLDYWSDRLDLDMAALKKEIDHLVAIHPHVIDFLRHMKKLDKKLYLITNAHPKALGIKLAKVKISDYFDKIVCSQDVGEPKEEPAFWHQLQSLIPFDKERTLLADDTPRVLLSAKQYGLTHLVHIAKPSSKGDTNFSSDYLSVANFAELIF